MKRITILIGLFFLLALPQGAWAQSLDEEPRVITQVRGDVIIPAEETVGDVVVVSGNVYIEGTVQGDVVVVSGNVQVTGTINGDLVVANGDIDVPGGQISGDLVTFRGHLNLGETAVVGGECVVLSGDNAGAGNCSQLDVPIGNMIDGIMPVSPPIPVEEVTPVVVQEGLSWRDVLSRTILLGMLAFVLGSVFPGQLVQVSDAVRERPVTSGIVGMLTIPAAFSLLFVTGLVATILLVTVILSCVGILGVPLMLALIVTVGGAAAMGWSAVGTLLGQKLAVSFKRKSMSLPMMAATGTAALTLATGGLSLLVWGFGGWLITAMLMVTGLGGAALTKLGRVPYPPVSGYNRGKVTSVLETLPQE